MVAAGGDLVADVEPVAAGVERGGRRVSSSPASMRRCWAAWLSRATVSLVGAASTTVSPRLAGVPTRRRGRRVPCGWRCRRGVGRGGRRGRRRWRRRERRRRRRVAFPVVGEAVDLVELDGAVGVDEVVEHAASADGGELHRVTDQGDAPASVVGEGGEVVEAVGGDHAGLVDDHGRSGREVVAVIGWPVEASVR